MDARASKRLPRPSEIHDGPRAEDGRDRHPLFTRFRPRDDQHFRFYNSMHSPEPMPSFDSISSEVPLTGLGGYTTCVFASPPALGVDHRIMTGRMDTNANTVAAPE